MKAKDGHYHRGVDVLGAGMVTKALAAVPPKTLAGKVAAAKASVVPRAGFVMKQTPGGNQHTSLVLNTPKKGDNASSIKNARDAGNRAVSVGNKLKQVLSKPTVAIKPPVAKPGSTAVHGLGPVARTKHAVLSVAQLKKAADTAVKLGKAALTHADKHEHLVQSNAKRVQVGTQAVQAKMSLKPGPAATHLHGEDGDDLEALHTMLGAYCDVLGDDATNPADPNSPGYLMDGSPDPSYGTPGSAATAAASTIPADSGAPTTAPALVPGQDFAPDNGDLSLTYNSADTSNGAPLPNGAVYYTGDHGFPYDGFTSFRRAAQGGAGADGYYFTGQGGPGDAMVWMRRTNGNDYALTGDNANYLNQKPYGPSDNWGPLVGNSVKATGDNAWLNGLRYDYGTKKWFWFRDKAPSWATASDDQQRLNQAILDYKAQQAAAAADAAAQAAQDKLDADNAAALAKQQALEDAATARQQQQEQTAAEHQAAVQAVADDTAQKQQAASDEASQREAQMQQEIDQKNAEAQAAIDQQAMETAARLDAEADQRAMDMAQKLDALSPPSDDQGDGGGEGADSGDTYAPNDGIDEPEDQQFNMDEDMLGLAHDLSILGHQDLSILGSVRGSNRLKHHGRRHR